MPVQGDAQFRSLCSYQKPLVVAALIIGTLAILFASLGLGGVSAFAAMRQTVSIPLLTVGIVLDIAAFASFLRCSKRLFERERQAPPFDGSDPSPQQQPSFQESLGEAPEIPPESPLVPPSQPSNSPQKVSSDIASPPGGAPLPKIPPPRPPRPPRVPTMAPAIPSPQPASPQTGLYPVISAFFRSAIPSWISQTSITTYGGNSNVPVTKGSGKLVSQKFSINSPVDSIYCQSPFNVEFTQGDQGELIKVADDNLIGFMQTKLNGTTLILTSSNCNYQSIAIPTYKIALPSISWIKLAGSGSVDIKKISSSSFFYCYISGSGGVKIHSGDLNEFGITLSGSGDFNSQAGSKKALVRISGSGNVILPVEIALGVFITGSGNCIIRGQPSIEKEIHGSGNLIGGS